MSYNNICVKKCPRNTYISDNDHSNEIMCIPECVKYIHQGKCVDHCPKFSINKTCVDFCSGNYKFQYKSLCESDCPNNTCLKENGINCTDECSFDPRDNTLADICPTHTPYRRQDISRHICVSECKVNEVLDDKYNCINVTECKRAVLSDGRCKGKCPPGYLYWAYDHQNTDNTYSYNVDDLKDNPCVTIIRACFPTILAGLFTLIYGLWFCLFISTKQMQCLQRRNVQAVKEQAEVNKELAEENVLETYEDTKDVRLIDAATEEQEATQKLYGEAFEENEDMHIVEVIIEEQRTRHELSGETFEVSEDVRLNELETEEPLMDRELSGETFDGIEEVRLTEVATNDV
ncbi:uncharacterized protein LOC123530670 [Mercenaria mercenaria]|uniref:uncharacterized protein LOC123530670 n=1 Tax=Mercenaria mercenaria TaxID=6596 RepID=UPI00234E51C6|nr:uncharacterized protein LOC123530670 [Mercenaria mercenaria]XP_053373606.1 uncharacterized protein LOC123530670 [Mercenaria mercenaria]XP_053373607.1 uncharacterized protein LOC123530670 [Mercenaria mercenaria]XP_053373608.1 uncharacterized protein LOC123530670 [Mercenaria mercenaria]XP_053373609.1 uncharacterized protein LOC123530670 [Mercenaria mercenaria]